MGETLPATERRELRMRGGTHMFVSLPLPMTGPVGWPQGIGAWPDKVTQNHMNALRKYEGQAAYEAAVRKLWRDSSARAKAIGLPELPRA